MTRVFIASLSTETNCSSPFPTGMSAFVENGISKSASADLTSYEGQILSVFRRMAEARGFEVVESISAFAQPAGRTVQHVYEELRETILDDLRAAQPVDFVFLGLHGAMVAVGYDDCEADIVARARRIAPSATIGVELDPHCHLSAELVSQADVVITYKEYPHTDGSDRAAELFDLCLRARENEVCPVAALLDTRMIGFYPTFDEPMRSVVAHARALETPPILSVSIAHGFPWADVADVGTRILIYADGDEVHAETAARALAENLYGHRHTLLPKYPEMAESLDRAATLDGLVVLGDYSDNPGGGAPGDSTFFLREVLERGLGDVAIGCFYDPSVARIAADAGIGARLQVRLGGKIGPISGDPLDLDVEVMGIAHDHTQECFEARQKVGLTVWLRHKTIDILVNDLRMQVYGTDMFTALGIDLATYKLVIVKSSSHFEHSFGRIARHMWRVATPGALDLNLAAFEYTKRDSDFFPRVPDPWATRGGPAIQIVRRN